MPRLGGGSASVGWLRLAVAAGITLLATTTTIIFALPSVAQRSPAPPLSQGDAAVTGFAGTRTIGSSRGDATVIDLNGASLRVIDLGQMGGPANAQLVPAPKPFAATATEIGQVFGVVLDNASPANIYVAASSAYGLPIVLASPDGQPRPARRGAPGATFMPGLWGGAAAGGGPGTVWKIDGTTGHVSLFTNVTLDGRSNSGPALGGMAYDALSGSLYVADRETGFIHRFGRKGRELDRYDHGVTARKAAGLVPVAFDPSGRLDISSGQFDSANPATWHYAPPDRRVFGLGISNRRLYYAVAAGLQIWSIGLNRDGSFASDPALELTIPPDTAASEISKIVFDGEDMILAERPAPTGAFNYAELTVPGIGRVLRYAPADGAQTGDHRWQAVPAEYAIGFPGNFRNGNGGAAIGYRYTLQGNRDTGSCGGFVWSTGERLRASADPTLASRLRQTGSLFVDGLQGNDVQDIRRDGQPPLPSYYVSYDDRDDATATGHLGDIAILLDCALGRTGGEVPPPGGRKGALGGGIATGGGPGGGAGGSPPGGGPTPPGGPPAPPTGCPTGQTRYADGQCSPVPCTRPSVLVGSVCCSPKNLQPNGVCAAQGPTCPPGQTPVGASQTCCPASSVFRDGSGTLACCPGGPVVGGKCNPSGPPGGCTPGSMNCCPNGYVQAGNSCCLSIRVTSTGICCPAGQNPGGVNNSKCEPAKVNNPQPPPGICCPAGKTPTSGGSCCDPNLLTTTGVCCPAGDPPDPSNRTNCPQQIQILHACARGEVWDGRACVKASSTSCPADSTGTPPSCKCLRGTEGAPGRCTPIRTNHCPSDSFGTWPNCSCKPGTTGKPGRCVQVPVNQCPADSVGTWPRCSCKPGTTGAPGNCSAPTANKCPSDSNGTWPRCECKPGTTGTAGSCKPAATNHCPADSVGTWPRCTCKPGTKGVPGNCAPTTVQHCPSDSVGKWPECTCKRGTIGTPGKCEKPGIGPRR